MVSKEHQRDKFRSFFTHEEKLSSYMAELLDVRDHDVVFEPCAGGGALIDALLKKEPGCNVVAYEIQSTLARTLAAKYAESPNVAVKLADTLFCEDLEIKSNWGPKFTKIIANPPYGAWQDYGRRAALKGRYRGFYVRETYALFLLRCCQLLAPSGRLVFIIPSTFLQLHSHIQLRKYLLESFTIDSVDIFPSNFFEGINFGYASLCILALRAESPSSEHKIRIRFVEDLCDLKCTEHASECSRWPKQTEILHAIDYSFPSGKNESIVDVHQFAGLRLGDIANCVTGFYSGADAEFLRVLNSATRGAARYKSVDPRVVADCCPTGEAIERGLDGPRTYVPILKGGGCKYVKPVAWYVDWSRDAVTHYRTDKKSRFQNASYYFRLGIGFPMVTSTRPTAAIIKDMLFDQSIVGIFPSDASLFYYILAYCNSSVFWRCLKTINPTANNSAKYVRKTPIWLPQGTVELSEINTITSQYVERLLAGESPDSRLEDAIDRKVTACVEKQLSVPFALGSQERDSGVAAFTGTENAHGRHNS